MKKLTRADWIAIIIFLVSMNIISLWTIDISLSAVLLPQEYKVMLTNGWRNSDPMLMYHLSLYLAMVTLLILSFICVKFILGEVKYDKRNN